MSYIYNLFTDEFPLKDYQMDGVDFISSVLCDPNKGGAILADEMGLGKTGIV